PLTCRLQAGEPARGELRPVLHRAEQRLDERVVIAHRLILQTHHLLSQRAQRRGLDEDLVQGVVLNGGLRSVAVALPAAAMAASQIVARPVRQRSLVLSAARTLRQPTPASPRWHTPRSTA